MFHIDTPFERIATVPFLGDISIHQNLQSIDVVPILCMPSTIALRFALHDEPKLIHGSDNRIAVNEITELKQMNK